MIAAPTGGFHRTKTGWRRAASQWPSSARRVSIGEAREGLRRSVSGSVASTRRP